MLVHPVQRGLLVSTHRKVNSAGPILKVRLYAPREEMILQCILHVEA